MRAQRGGNKAPRAPLTGLGQEWAGPCAISPGGEAPLCWERWNSRCGCGVASGGQRIEGKALQTRLRGVGAGW